MYYIYCQQIDLIKNIKINNKNQQNAKEDIYKLMTVILFSLILRKYVC